MSIVQLACTLYNMFHFMNTIIYNMLSLYVITTCTNKYLHEHYNMNMYLYDIRCIMHLLHDELYKCISQNNM